MVAAEAERKAVNPFIKLRIGVADVNYTRNTCMKMKHVLSLQCL